MLKTNSKLMSPKNPKLQPITKNDYNYSPQSNQTPKIPDINRKNQVSFLPDINRKNKFEPKYLNGKIDGNMADMDRSDE